MIPDNATPLDGHEGFVYVEQVREDYYSREPQGYDFVLYRTDYNERLYAAYVNMPLKQKHRAKDALPDAAMITPRSHGRAFGEQTTRAIAACLMLAADKAVELNTIAWPELQKQAQERAKLMEENALRFQRDDDQYKRLYEQVVWLIGSKFRLRRRGKRASVFGEIIRVYPEPLPDGSPPPESFMQTVSEKGVAMNIRLRDVILMEIKAEDSDRRYDQIYKEEVKRADATS